jgi:hypothetical protein
LVLKEYLATTEQVFAFITYRWRSKYIKGKAGKIGLTIIEPLPIVNYIKIFIIGDFKRALF